MRREDFQDYYKELGLQVNSNQEIEEIPQKQEDEYVPIGAPFHHND
jgi:hypothetical protein